MCIAQESCQASQDNVNLPSQLKRCLTKSKQVPAAASSESLYQTHSQTIWPGNPVHPFLRLLHISILLLVGGFNPSEKY